MCQIILWAKLMGAKLISVVINSCLMLAFPLPQNKTSICLGACFARAQRCRFRSNIVLAHQGFLACAT